MMMRETLLAVYMTIIIGLQCLCQHNILGNECLVCVVDSQRQYTSNETVSGRTYPHLIAECVCLQ